MKHNVLVTLLLLFFGMASCSPSAWAQLSEGNVAKKAENSIRILSITPNNAETLRAGDPIEIAVEAEFTVTKSPATIALIIQNGERREGSPVLLGREKENVSGLTGKVTLKHKITVPETQTILVFTPLFAEGVKTTSMTNSTLDMRVYRVEKKDVAR